LSRQPDWLPILLALAVLGLAGCVRSAAQNQMRLGVRASQQGLWDEAVRHWEKALDQDPGSAAVHNNIAVACEKKGLWDEARREYQEALRLAPDNAQIQFNYEQFENNRKAFDSGGSARQSRAEQIRHE